jgi:hypothetical protein
VTSAEVAPLQATDITAACGLLIATNTAGELMLRWQLFWAVAVSGVYGELPSPEAYESPMTTTYGLE